MPTIKSAFSSTYKTTAIDPYKAANAATNHEAIEATITTTHESTFKTAEL